MSEFKASEAISALDYDLAPYIKGKEAKGTIPEPSQDALRVYQRAIRSESPEGNPKRLSDLTDDEAEAARTKLLAALAEFCQGTPSAATMAKLPHRVFLAFCGWLWGSYTNPT